MIFQNKNFTNKSNVNNNLTNVKPFILNIK